MPGERRLPSGNAPNPKHSFRCLKSRTLSTSLLFDADLSNNAVLINPADRHLKGNMASSRWKRREKIPF